VNFSLRKFFVRADPAYTAAVAQYQATTPSSKAINLLLHLLPGVLAYALINVATVHAAGLALTRLSDPNYQAMVLVFVTLVWHAGVPFVVLTQVDRLTPRAAIAFLGLDRWDRKGLLVIVPLAFILYTLVSLPFMKYVYGPLGAAINSVPVLRTPDWVIFQDARVYNLAPGFLVLLAVGNFVGEEVYFRGYLLKKIGFLGRWAWVVNSLLFAFYHVWQPAMTWPLAALSLAFGFLMQCRKTLAPLILFHFLANVVWGAIIGMVLQ